jgi:hypothetical protein
MRLSHLATSVFWFLPVVLQSLVAFIMFRRRLVRQFHVFFSFNLFVPARDVALYFLPFSGNLYSAVFWWGEAVGIILELGVIAENIWHFIRPYPFLRRFSKLLAAAVLIAAVAAFGMLIWVNGPSGTDLALERIILLERSATFLQVCMLVVAIALMSRLALTWHSYSVGIAAGFGVYAALDLVLLELRAHLHALSDTAFVLMRSAAYNLGVAIWAFYFLRPQFGTPVDRLPGSELATWNDTVRPHVNKWYRR